MDCWVQPRHQLLIAFAKFTESLCLGSKKVRNGVRILAGFELCSKGMCFKGFLVKVWYSFSAALNIAVKLSVEGPAVGLFVDMGVAGGN